MSLAFYRPTDSFFEKLHPATRLIALVMAFIPPFFSRTPLEGLPYFALLLAAAALAGALPNVRKVGGIMVILFVMSVILWSVFQRGGTPLVALGPVAVTSEGLRFGTTVGIRFNCFVLAAVIFFTATRIEDFTYGLSRLGLPFVVSFTLSLAFRLTPLFMETGQAIVLAQKARGLDLDAGGPLARLRRHIPIIVPVLISSLRRADQLAVALESKGFGRQGQRTVLAEYRLTWRDAVLPAVLLAVIVLSVLA